MCVCVCIEMMSEEKVNDQMQVFAEYIVWKQISTKQTNSTNNHSLMASLH